MKRKCNDRDTAAIDRTTDFRSAGDPLAIVPRVLDLIRFTGAIFFRASFRAPWAYTSPATPELIDILPPGEGSLVMFHVVAEGQCWAALEDGSDIRCAPVTS